MGHATKIISVFISNPRAEVLAIKGPWGSGKTYAWTQLIKDFTEQGKVSKPKYAYVSLFGVNSLDKLKDAIFDQTLDTSALGEGIGTLGKCLDGIANEHLVKANTAETSGKRLNRMLKNEDFQ